MILLRICIFLFGTILAARTVFSAIKPFVLLRSAPTRQTRLVFHIIRVMLNLPRKQAYTFRERDRILAFYAPIGLIALAPTAYVLVGIGYTCMYWALGAETWFQ